MTKKIFLIAFFLIFHFAFSQVNGVFTTQLSSYQVVSKSPYVLVENPESNDYTSQIGAPRLPVFSKTYALPAGSTVTSININNGSKVLLGSAFYAYPVQPSNSSNSQNIPDFVPPDPIIYNSATPFPASTVTTAFDGSKFGYHIITLNICPFEYIPSEKKLYLYNQIDFTIQYSIGEINYQLKITKRRNQLTIDNIKSLVQNPEMITPAARPSIHITDDLVSTDKLIIPWKPSAYEHAVIPDFVIITNETLKPSFKALADYKIQKGIPTVIVTVEEIYKNYSGVDNPEKIRNYLKSAHQYWGSALFVLLGGDTEIIPGRIASYYAGQKNYSDLYYGDVYKPNTPNYNWNTNGDADFGSTSDICELIADNILGRAPVHNEAEVVKYINKIINYEKLFGVSDMNYVNNMLFAGSYYNYNRATNTPLGGSIEIAALGQQWHTLLAQKPFLSDSRFKKWLLYDDPFGDPFGHIDPVSEDPIQPFLGNEELRRESFLNNVKFGQAGIGKFHLISGFDHGSPYGFGTSSKKNLESVYNADMDGLANDPYYKIMYTTGCDVGAFQYDCFAEHFVNADYGGGVAMIANSGEVPTGGNEQDNKLLESIYGSLPGDSHVLGVAFTNAREAVGIPFEPLRPKQLTLFGDPTTEVWSDAPQTITFTNIPTSITISNTIANTLPVSILALDQEATVTLYKYNTFTSSVEVYASQRIPVGGTSVQFILNPDTAGTLQVKVTAKNYLPASAEVNILLPQAHLYITDYIITDSNGNGIIEQGETINLSINLTNSGNVSISGINTTLSCDPIFGLITNNQASYSQTISAGQTVPLSGFSFVANVEQANAPLPNYIEFMLNITANAGYVHLDNFYVELKNSKLVLGARNLTNDIGDVKNLNVFLNNLGDIATGSLDAVLTTDLGNDIVQITQSTGTYVDWQPLTEQRNSSPFKFTVASSYSGPLTFTLTLKNSSTPPREWIYNFDLSEELPPLISGFKFTSTNNQIVVAWNRIANNSDGTPSISGYNIYKSETLDGNNYLKQNDFLINDYSAFYTDNDVNSTELSIYYYKISVVSLTGNELPLTLVTTSGSPAQQGYKAWTTLGYSTGFPITASLAGGAGTSSPTLYDVDNDGTKEIFVNYKGSNSNTGKIMGYYNTGQEMYDIDGDANTVSGFVTTDIAMVTNSAVGDLDNDGHAEVLSVGRNDGANQGKVFVYKTIDTNGDNKPDLFFDDETINVGWKINTNPVLYDVDGNGFLDIIIVDEKQTVYVFDKDMNLLPGWPKQVTNPINTEPATNYVDYSEGHIAVADLDHDGKGEIAIGLRYGGSGTKGAIFIWRYDGTPFSDNPFHEFPVNERADGAIVFADIDNDFNLDLITTTRRQQLGKIYAFKQDGTPINPQWNGANILALPSPSTDPITMPKISVGNLDHDSNNNLEISFGSSNHFFVLNKDGVLISSNDISFRVAANSYSTPILADVDSDSDAEIIINSDGKIYAFNFDGSDAVGFPFESKTALNPFIGSPSIDDIDNDGKNELVISDKNFTTHVFRTDGHSINNEWSSFRGNPHNTGTYKEICNQRLDLCIKDGTTDRGIEPNTSTEFMWTSSDIWVRNNNDNSLEHQNPKYRASGSPNYIKVRITNKSCVESTGAESVTIFWAKASTGLGWYDPWHGNILNDFGAEMGHEVGTLQIPQMQKGKEIVLSFPWIVPNPNFYGTDGNQWHFCLMAQINGGEGDPLTFPLIPDLNQNVGNNNNLAWKNVTVVNSQIGEIEPGGVIAVANPFEIPKTFYLEMAIADLETGKPIYDEAEVKIKMDEVLYRAWERGGKEAQLLDPTTDEKRKIVKGNHMILDNIAFLPNEIGTLKLTFNFLTKELTPKSNYVYHVMQKDVQTGEIIGGETFLINKNARIPFEADAGPDKEVDLNQPITISAADINEPAIYNWYDDNGKLIFQGKDLQIANAVAKKYKLEVISTIDGFKDYSEVEVTLKPNRLKSIAPNPATDHVNVYYKVNEASSAYLMIVSYYMNGGISNNYVLDINESEANINLSNYPNGFYKVILVANGSVVDAKLLFKQ